MVDASPDGREVLRPPRISVVIPAYSRRAFLVAAVRSVLSQRRTPADAEVIVVKNFHDPEIDRFLDSEGIRVLDSGSALYGTMLAMGVRECTGDIVAILEDDDLFDRQKLARLREVFDRVPGLTFYHNDYAEIDVRGSACPPSDQRREIDLRTRSRAAEVVDDRDKVAAFDRMEDSVAEAHVSCLALPRDALLRVLRYLEPINIGADFFLFFVGLASSGPMMVDPGKFTLYRRHPANSSRALAYDPAVYHELVEGSRVMAVQTREMLNSLGAERFLAVLEQELVAHRLYLAVSAPRPGRRPVAEAIVGMMRRPRSFRGVGRFGLFARSFVYLVVPGVAVRLFRPSVAPPTLTPA
jgi:hypothetical protein